MFLLNWILAVIRRISHKPFIFITKNSSYQTFDEGSSNSTSPLFKRSGCQMIAPGLPRQRLDGLEIIVHCECEGEKLDGEEEESISSDENSTKTVSSMPPFVSKTTSTKIPCYSSSCCQTSFCDISSLQGCNNNGTSLNEPETLWSNEIAACSSPDEKRVPLPNIQEAFAEAISQQAWLRYSQKAINVGNAEEQSVGLQAAEEMWQKMSSLQKLPYYWDAIEHDPICRIPFENYTNYFQSRRKTTSPRSQSRISKSWKRMNYKQRLPFIIESFIYKMVNSERCFDEQCIKKFFNQYRRQASRANISTQK